MKHRPWLKYVHRFGYFSSIIVVLQLLLLSSIGAEDWVRREARREKTRMRQGPAADRLSRLSGGQTEIALLNRLPPLSALAPDGIRFVATPSFGDNYFSIALRRTPSGGEGVVLMVSRNTDDDEVPRAQSMQIKLTSKAYNKLTSDLDAMASSWRGESGVWTDGTEIVIERVRNGGVTSGSGNSPNYYGKIGALVYRAVRPLTPQLARFNGDWHPKEGFSASSANGS